jgi:hypothetical protein
MRVTSVPVLADVAAALWALWATDKAIYISAFLCYLIGYN